MKFRLSLSVLFIFLSLLLTFAKDVPFLSGRIVDEARILSAQTISELEQILATHEQATSNQIAVLIVTSLEDEVLEAYSIKVAETWKLGKKGTDNGVLFLVSIDDRKMRIEVGYGLEGDLTDAMARRIIRNEITPNFRRGDYDEGIKAGVIAIIGVIEGSYVNEEMDDTEFPVFSKKEQILMGVFVMSILGLFTFIGLFVKGGAGWFMYFFLIPFYAIFPSVIFGLTAGMGILGTYLIGFAALRLFLQHTTPGKSFAKKVGNFESSSGSFGTGGGWTSSSRSGGWSSGGSSWSGGGGSFGGGGSSGSW